MTKSESIKEITPAFLAAQMEMEPAPKDARNPHFDSKYSDFASVVAAVRQPLHTHDIAYLQPVRLTDAGVEIETILLHKSGEFFSETLLIPIDKRNAQGVGSAISYGKRYGLQSICGIPSEDDDGNAASGERDAPQRQQRPAQRPAPPQQQPATIPPQQTSTPDEDEKFIILFREAFEARDFKPEEIALAVSAVCRHKNVHLITKLNGPDRQAFLQAITEGRFDKHKAKPTKDATLASV